MKTIIRLSHILFSLVMIISFVFCCSRLGKEDDKIIFYYIFLSILLMYMSAYIFSVWRFYKTADNLYISITMGFIYLVFMIWVYLVPLLFFFRPTTWAKATHQISAVVGLLVPLLVFFRPTTWAKATHRISAVVGLFSTNNTSESNAPNLKIQNIFYS